MRTHFVQDAAQITDYLDEGNLTIPALRSLLRILDPMLQRSRRYLEIMPRRGYDNHRLCMMDLEILLSAVTYLNRKQNFSVSPWAVPPRRSVSAIHFNTTTFVSEECSSEINLALKTWTEAPGLHHVDLMFVKGYNIDLSPTSGASDCSTHAMERLVEWAMWLPPHLRVRHVSFYKKKNLEHLESVLNRKVDLKAIDLSDCLVGNHGCEVIASCLKKQKSLDVFYMMRELGVGSENLEQLEDKALALLISSLKHTPVAKLAFCGLPLGQEAKYSLRRLLDDPRMLLQIVSVGPAINMDEDGFEYPGGRSTRECLERNKLYHKAARLMIPGKVQPPSVLGRAIAAAQDHACRGTDRHLGDYTGGVRVWPTAGYILVKAVVEAGGVATMSRSRPHT